jgi:hypothetical protein
MNYRNIYNSIIDRYKSQQGLTEKHHIIPRCMGGSDDPENLVAVSPRVHYILHLLLYKFVEKKYRKQMWYAVWNMSHQGKTKSGSMYQFIREQASERQREIRGNRVPWNKGKKHSPETIEKLRNTRKGKTYGKFWRVEYKGTIYNSIKECINLTGDSYYSITTYGKKLEKYRP